MFAVHARSLIRRLTFEERIRTIYLTGYLRDENADDSPKAKAAKKLNLLLQSIIKDDTISREEKPQSLAMSVTKFKKQRVKKQPKPKNLGEKIVEAAKEVATNIEGKPEVNEAELLHKLLYKNERLQTSVFKASNNKILSELLSGMEIEQTPERKDKLKDGQHSRADDVRSLLSGRKVFDKFKVQSPSSTTEKIDLFGAKPLGMFSKMSKDVEEEIKLPTWEHCHARELKLSVTHPPANIYQQFIIWTDRGILWKFPIDNEQGLEEEKKVSFAEHVFLENHLEDWCPERGPIRHFMELVCVGLSRNFWLTAKEKKDHILWYRDYFLDKRAIIEEIGAGEFRQPTANQVADS